MSKIIFILLLFSSCTIKRYYNVKDLKRGFKKYEKSLFKNEQRLKEDIKFQNSIITQAKNVDEKKYDSLEIYIQKSGKHLEHIQALISEFREKRSHLKLRGKIINSSDKNFDKINPFNEYIESHAERVNGILKNFQENRRELVEALRKSDLLVVKTKNIKSQFDKFNRKFSKTYDKIKTSVRKFEQQLKKTKHKNKTKIKKELIVLKNILSSVQRETWEVKKIVNSFHERFGKLENLLHGPKSPAYIAIQDLKNRVKHLNSQLKEFNAKSQEIEELSE